MKTSSLQTTADLLADDLQSVTGHAVTGGTGTPAAGDIVLAGGSHGAEGYPLEVGRWNAGARSVPTGRRRAATAARCSPSWPRR
ncbi:hypothetical protein [Streptomyces sp. H51]|uniref:hypothetical protein n=1 Tax=Streptomyces sp. H51 TaxID=3111770 RepID=UPI003B642642